jgi:hypothetical protein
MNNELQKTWKETVVGTCMLDMRKTTLCPVSRPRFKPTTFQIKIQKANNCTPNIWKNTSNTSTNDNASLLGYYGMLNTKQQYSACLQGLLSSWTAWSWGWQPQADPMKHRELFMTLCRINILRWHCDRTAERISNFTWVITCEVTRQSEV